MFFFNCPRNYFYYIFVFYHNHILSSDGIHLDSTYENGFFIYGLLLFFNAATHKQKSGEVINLAKEYAKGAGMQRYGTKKFEWMSKRKYVTMNEKKIDCFFLFSCFWFVYFVFGIVLYENCEIFLVLNYANFIFSLCSSLNWIIVYRIE